MSVEYRTIGRTTLQVSELCLGTMTFGWSTEQETAFEMMDRAVEAGINFFDTADIYSMWINGNHGGESEAIIGAWIASRKPENLIIATKVRGKMWDGPYGEGLSRRHITRAVEDSLRRLHVETIDLYQTHWPDDDTALEETFETFAGLIEQGKIRAIGTSNHSAEKLIETLQLSTDQPLPRYESLQPHYSMAYRKEFEEELKAVCEENNLAVIPYSPLAAGFLTGKHRRGASPDTTRSSSIGKYLNEQNFALLDIIDEIGAAHGKTTSQVALAWQLSQPVITAPIVGARTVEQLEESLGALGFRLSKDEMTRLNGASAWE